MDLNILINDRKFYSNNVFDIGIFNMQADFMIGVMLLSVIVTEWTVLFLISLLRGIYR